MATMQAWNYSSAVGGLSSHLRLRSDVAKPAEGYALKDNEILVEVHAVSINPADYKVPAFPLVGKYICPSIPGTDYSGRVASAHPSNPKFSVGQEVFGRIDVFQFGGKKNGVLAQFVVAETEEVALVPSGMSLDEAAAIGTAGLTAFESLSLGHLRDKKVFINGGSGGTGIFAIQIAKALGATVTTTCSTANVELCKELGADEVIDYKTTNVLSTLKSGGRTYDYAIDNVGQDLSLLSNSSRYLKPKADFVQVGGSGVVLAKAHMIAVTPCLRIGKNPVTTVAVKQKTASLSRVARWVDEGSIKIIFDSKYSFADTPKAFERLQTGRAKGKILIHVKEPEHVVEPKSEEVPEVVAEPVISEKEIAAEPSVHEDAQSAEAEERAASPISPPAAEAHSTKDVEHSAEHTTTSEEPTTLAEVPTDSSAAENTTTVDKPAPTSS